MRIDKLLDEYIWSLQWFNWYFPPKEFIGLNPDHCMHCQRRMAPYLDKIGKDVDGIIIETATLCINCSAIFGYHTFYICFCQSCGVQLKPNFDTYPFLFNNYNNRYYCKSCHSGIHEVKNEH